MRAVRLYGVGDLRVETVPAPALSGHDAVHLRVLAAGICGSDLHNFRTGQWIARTPSIPGHELAGEVITVGPAVTRLKPGDRVVADSRVWCGACPSCRMGQPHLCDALGYVGEVCDGGFADSVVLPERLLHRVDPALEPAIAATAEPVAVALHAYRRLGAAADAPILVAGCGPIGGLVALLARHDGHRVLVADHHLARRRRVAEVTGAEAVALDPSAVATAMGGAAIGYAVDATGSVAALAALLGVIGKGGTIALVGITHGRLDLDPNTIVEREISLLGCSAFRDELPLAIARLPGLAADIARFLAPAIGLEAVPQAYGRLIAGEIAELKVIVTP